ncbi:GNAT family N-acetyltransferase [Nocardioides aurantiacus]|uniref:Putative acetyltransferase n=1 Tax=Nocardioides aurantiacus TaxID=86796 RepID=A0A3N2CP40_9ACTN|nr:GNAT family N-acetyltransferase [Nocardioides aurantiacus]ROR89272.1 putative acetyltransferase [Nocardioides aurantiacus]
MSPDPTVSPAAPGVVPPAPHLAEPSMDHVTAASFEDWMKAVARGFQEEHHPETLALDREVFEDDRSFGFRVGDRWVSTCGALTRELGVPGGFSVPTAAVTVVTVHPPYRRRGLLSAMMRHQLEDVARRGEPLAALWASESLIYGRFGYGPAVSRLQLRGRTRSLDFLPGVRTGGSVDELTREQFLTVVRPLHERLRRDRPGTMARPADHSWEFALFDQPFARDGATELRHVVHWSEAGEVDGFATYRFKEDQTATEPDSEVRINELWAEDPVAHATLWRYLLDLDLARRFRARNAPSDELLRLLVHDARAVGTEVLDALYVRVVDVAAALRARSYAAPLDVVIEVADDLLPANAGRWRVRTDGPAESTTVERTDDPADVALGVLELGTVYLGGVRLADLHRVGRVTEHTPGAVAAAGTAFSWHRAPWCPDFF